MLDATNSGLSDVKLILNALRYFSLLLLGITVTILPVMSLAVRIFEEWKAFVGF